jgi:DNA-binding CsgD family transcriptional regulator
MSDVDSSYSTWLDLVAALLLRPDPNTCPRQAVGELLAETFECDVSWKRRDADGLTHLVVHDADGFSGSDLVLACRIQPLLELLDRQVLVLEQRRAERIDLTGRERATLILLADGLTAGAIAHRLGVSPRTVNKHLEHLYRKLGVRDRLQAVLVARDAGLVCAGGGGLAR